MLKLLIFGLLGICLLTIGSRCHAQERNFAPYLGASVTIASVDGPGWGVEMGTRFYMFYAGIEYGLYGYNLTLNTEDPVPGSSGPPLPLPDIGEPERFWGIHVGYVLEHNLYIGAVMLRSFQIWDSKWDTSTFKYITFTRVYLNFGPDFRYAGLANGHMYIAVAFTVRRWFKFGLGYMF